MVCLNQYEIDVLNVGAADAILIHYLDEDKDHVILVDCGNYENGWKVSDFINEKYHTVDVDLAICTHCDADHYGGFISLIEDGMVNIGGFLINDPGNHVNVEDIKRYGNQDNAEREARTVFTLDNGKNLLDVIDRNGIPRMERFSGKVDPNNRFQILGPSKEYYESLVYKFRNKLDPYKEEEDAEDAELKEGKCYSKTLANTPDDESAHNQSSIIFTWEPYPGKKFLFMGDAGRDAVNHMTKEQQEAMRNVYWLKVPHHGSKHNLDNDMINLIKPSVSYVSTEKYGKYLSRAVVSALKKAGSKFYSTHQSGDMRCYEGFGARQGYGPLEEL